MDNSSNQNLSALRFIKYLVGRVSTNSPGDLGSIPCRVIPKTYKMVLDTSLLNTQHYKVLSRIKWSNPEKGVTPSSIPRCSNYWKGNLQVALDYGRQLYFLYSHTHTHTHTHTHIYIYIYIWGKCKYISQYVNMKYQYICSYMNNMLTIKVSVFETSFRLMSVCDDMNHPNRYTTHIENCYLLIDLFLKNGNVFAVNLKLKKNPIRIRFFKNLKYNLCSLEIEETFFYLKNFS